MNKTRNRNVLSTSVIPSWQLFLMFFIAFYGILTPIWIFFMCCGYPHWSISGLPITVNNFVRGIQIISVLLFGYIVVRTFRMEGFKGFPGISIPLAILLVALFVRQIFDFWYLRNHFGPRVLGLLSFNIMLLAFSIRYNNQSLHKTIRYGVFIPALILAGIMLFTWSDYFTNGLTMRSRDFRSNEISVFQSIERSIDQDSVSVPSPRPRIFLTVGSVVGLFALTLIESKKIWYLCFILPVHIGGTSLVLFTGYRSFLVAYLGTCLFILIISLLKRFREGVLNKGTLNTIVFIVTIIVADIFLVCTIGFNDKQSTATRLQRFIHAKARYQADVQTFVSSLGTDAVQIMPDTHKNDPTVADNSETVDNSSSSPNLELQFYMEIQHNEEGFSSVPPPRIQCLPWAKLGTRTIDNSELIGCVEATNDPAVINGKDQKRSNDNKSIASSSLPSNVFYEFPYSSLKSKKIRYLRSGDYHYLCDLTGIGDPRLVQIKLATDLIKRHPYLGYSSIFVLNLKGEPVRMPLHSNILIVFVAIGIIGGGLFLYIVFCGFIHAAHVVFYDVRLALLPALFLNDFLINLINSQVLQCVWLFVPLVVMRSIIKSQIIEKNTATNQKNEVENL